MGTNDPGGGNYASIDPGALKAAEGQLQKSVNGVTGSIAGLTTQFDECGVPTTHIDALKRIAAKISPVLPEINRRISLAQQLVAENPGGGKVAYFEGDLLGQFKTVAAAKAQAHIDAGKVKDAREHGDNIPQGVYDDLAKYGNDPDYATAFVKDLSPDVTSYLLLHVEHYTSDRKPDKKNLAAVAQTFATASYHVKFDQKYFADLEKANGDNGLGLDPLTIFTPLMRTGVWSKTSLENVADQIFQPPQSMNEQMNSDNVLAGLANNPLAAADYYHKNQQLMYDLGNDKGPLEPHYPDYTNFLHSATIDARSIYARMQLDNPKVANLAEQNANYLINQVGKNGDKSHGLLYKTYADIGVEYFDDYQKTLMSPVDTSGGNAPWLAVNASDGTWTNFFRQGMKDDQGLFELTNTFKTHVSDLNSQITSQTDDAQHSGGDKAPWLDPRYATAWTRYTRDQMQADFKTALNGADKDINKSYDDRVNGIQSAISKGLDWVTDPEGIPSDLVSMGEDQVKSYVSSELTSLVAGDPPKLPSQKVKITDTSLDSGNDYAYDATNQYNDAIDKHYKHPFEGSYNDGQITWDGDPSLYNDPKHPFVDPATHKIKPFSEIRNDPTALENYIQWLQDPNVQSHVAYNEGRPR